MYFSRTKQLAPIPQERLLSILSAAAPNAYVDAGRPAYTPLVRDDVVLFLARTQVDRFKWRESQPATDTPEVVCTSFSLLLWALIEQQRLIDRVPRPFAAFRVRWLRHSMVGFVDEGDHVRLIEPQDDEIISVTGFKFTHPEEDMQHITCL